MAIIVNPEITGDAGVNTLTNANKGYTYMSGQGGDDTYIVENVSNSFIPNSLTSEIRSSIFLLGPMLAKLKKAKISFPGGCNIGNRPIDLHLKNLKSLNVKISTQG